MKDLCVVLGITTAVFCGLTLIISHHFDMVLGQVRSQRQFKIADKEYVCVETLRSAIKSMVDKEFNK